MAALTAVPDALVRPPPSAAAPTVSLGSAKAEVTTGKVRCETLRTANGVVPGQSWGRLSEVLIAEWKARRCDQFYCQPSPMEAVGQYRCVPLVRVASSSTEKEPQVPGTSTSTLYK